MQRNLQKHENNFRKSIFYPTFLKEAIFKFYFFVNLTAIVNEGLEIFKS